ncbi:MAG: hypothetical protein R3F54_02625 [Alphaproteobacteria bacterium]
MLVLHGGTALHAAEQGFEPVIAIAPDDPGIDDPLMLRLSIEVPDDLLVNFPRLGARLGSFAVTGQRALEAEAEAGGSREWVQQYRLEPENTGDLTIPPFTITVQDPETLQAIEVTTDEMVVHIASLVPPETDLREVRDILPPVALPPVAAGPSPWLLAAFALAASALVIWWRRRRPLQEAGSDLAQPPHLAALEALAALRAEQASDEAGSERFHTRLAAVLRRYLQDAFSLPGPLKTTEEILRDAARAPGPLREQQGLIEQPLGQCDLVKFARYRPSAEAMGQALDQIAAFVRRTSGVETGESGSAPEKADLTRPAEPSIFRPAR